MMSHPAGDSFGLRGPALDDSLIEALAETPGPGVPEPRRWRRLVDWSATSAPVALLLLAGVALGPHGIHLLSVGTLALLAPAIPVGLAALGALVGLSLGGGRTGDRRLFAAASLDAAVTMLLVSGGLAALAFAGAPSNIHPLWTVVAGAGICAAGSLTLPTGNPLEPRTVVTRIIELGVLLPIVVGGVALAWLRAGSPVGALVLVAQASCLTLALAAAVWLLLTRASTGTEERVLTVSALLLVGGVADALSLSALLGGAVAGVFWRYAGRQPPETIGRDVLFAQHPLLVLLLLVAGASAQLTLPALALGAAYAALRVAGRLAGGALARLAAGRHAPRDLGFHLLPSGVFGVAFALNAAALLGADGALLHTAVVAGTIASEFVAFVMPPRRDEA